MTFSAAWPTVSANSLSKKIGGLGDKSKQDKVVGDMARQARDIARSQAPHGKTGNLARTIYVEKVSDSVYDVGSPLVYAWAVEFGSGVFGEGPDATGEPIEPKTSDFLRFQLDGEWKKVRFVLGQRPQPFLRPACEQVDSGSSFSGFVD